MSTATTPGKTTELIDVTPDLLEQWTRQGDTVIVDVREDFEHAEERIDGAELMPLSKFDAAALRAKHGGHKVVFQCRSGRRSADAAGRYAAADEKVFHLAGGIEAWKASGRPVIKPKKANRIPVMRQVQIVAGSLVAVGVALGAFVHPAFLALPGFVGCGLVFAGISGWCGMAMLLGRMPWNRAGGAS
jgi:rhodanese-related sulfurtransferase